MILLLAAGLAAPAVAAPEKPHYRIPKTGGEVKIDGRIDEEAWSHAIALPLAIEIDPGINVPAPVAGTAYLMYDEGYLYAAFRCDDPSPKDIRAHLTDRDEPFRDDFVGLMLDTFNDERRGYELFVNPLGVQMDLAMNEASSDDKEDANWDAIWTSAGQVGESGYTVEMAIPFKSLRFQKSDGEQTWGVMPFRSYPRSLRHQIALVAFDPDNNCTLCQLPKMTGFEGATPGRNVELDPTATAHRTDLREGFPSGGMNTGKVESDVGLTARWGITPNMVLSGAINPDFSQVEADAAQLDVNTDFALFYAEKRPFFLEGADFFSTPYNIVHTRTVADPTWGIKLTGKQGKDGIGVFVAQDEVTNLLVPGSQSSGTASLDGGSTDTALRYRRDVGSASMLGALVTKRQGERGYENTVYGVDGQLRPSASDRIVFQALGSRSAYPVQPGLAGVNPHDSLDGSAMRLGYSHDTQEWSIYARKEILSRGFRADLGFMPRVGYSFDLAGLERTWRPKEKTWYTRYSLGGDYDKATDANDTVLEEEWEFWASLAGPLQSFYNLDAGWRDRFWNGVTYRQQFVNASLEMRPTGALSLFAQAGVGDTIDFAHSRGADQIRLDPSISYSFGKRLRLGLDHHYQRLTVDGGELFTANLTQLRTVYQINLRTFVRAILQYEDLDRSRLYTAGDGPGRDKDLFSQLLFAYKLNPQTVLFLGYSDNQAGDGQIDLTRTDRTLFFKVGYAFVL
ncbi:MAG: sugar-binding protein [Thermoanaerobaculia bacterium]